MKKILLTGGSGSIGKAFIKKYYDKYDFFNISRNEENQERLKNYFPKVKSYCCSIENYCLMEKIFCEVKPDIVIHLAAMKHIGLVEKNPIQGCLTNIVGSLNVMNACLAAHVPLTIGISTDKACKPESTYGYTKALVEKCFCDVNSEECKFVVTRFANVAGSSYSVIPKWFEMRNEGIPLKVTDKRMNRMFFSLQESAEFIENVIQLSNQYNGCVYVNGNMKSLNIYRLACLISDNIEIIGKISDVEKFDEVLIDENELKFTEIIQNNMIIIKKHETDPEKRLKRAFDTINCDKMTDSEILNLIKSCENEKN